MFVHQKTHFHEDRNCEITEYLHSSGLRHFHLHTSFPEMSFALSLKTPPHDDTGLPHILEHLTLCGSDKFPIKDPFMAMQYRSVAHDLNAATAPLSTIYHFATTLQKDFLNLVDLYSDLVFNPLLRREDFEQEGWRLEQTPQGPKMKGVVLNEMKGAYTSGPHDHRVGLFSLLAPHTALAYSSGGHPNAITGLTYEDVVSFHNKYYTPENAVLVTCGDIAIEKVHNIISSCLFRHGSKPANPSLSKTFSPPLVEENDGVFTIQGFGQDVDHVNVSWAYTSEGPKDAYEDLFDQMMHSALFNQPGNLLEEIGLKHSLSAGGSYIFNGLMEVSGQCGTLLSCANLPVEKLDMIGELGSQIFQAIEDVKNQPISDETWQAAREGFRGSIVAALDNSPADEAMNLSTSLGWGFDVLRSSQNKKILENDLSSPPTQEQIKDWVEKRFSASPYVIVFKQNPDLPRVWEQKEQVKVEELIFDGKVKEALPKEQSRDLSLLPSLNAEDAVVKFDRPTVETEKENIFHTHVKIKSKTSLVGVVLDGGSLSFEEVNQLICFSKMFGFLGTKNNKSSQARSDLEKNGVNVEMSLSVSATKNSQVGRMITFMGQGLEENVSHITRALKERMDFPPLWEEDEFKKLLHVQKAHFVKSLPERINQLTKTEALAPYLESARLSAAQLRFVIDNHLNLLKEYENNPKMAFDDFCAIWKKVGLLPRHVISAGSEMVKDAAQDLRSGRVTFELPMLSSVKTEPAPEGFAFHKTNQAVNFCYRAFPAPHQDHPSNAYVKVACALLQKPIHSAIREEGGAYGSGISHLNGAFVLSSFRDPHVKETFAQFGQVENWLGDIIAQKDEEALHEAKLSLVKGLLAPRPPLEQAQEVISRLISGVSDEYHPDLVKKIWQTSWQDIENIKEWFSPDPFLTTDRASVTREFTSDTPNPTLS